MAKNFKTLSPPVVLTEPAKPISERDFFDLTDDPIDQLANKQRGNNTTHTSNINNIPDTTADNTDRTPSSNTRNTTNTNNTRNTTNIDNTNNTILSSNISNTNITSNTSVTDITSYSLNTLAGKVLGTEDRDVRQTFVVSSTQLEQLRDYVHARRAQGNYEYSQKQALQEALSLLLASVPEAPPRPSQTRELEQQRRDRIRRGRQTSTGE